MMQPYLEYYNSNEQTKKNEFSQMINMNDYSIQIEPQSSICLPLQSQKKKNKSINFDNKRSALVHTSESSETRFQDFQGD